MTAMVSFAAQTCAMPPCIMKCIQDLHSLVHKGISLHNDCDLNGSYELFGLVLNPIKWFRIGSLGTSGWVVQGLDGYAGLEVHCDSLCHIGNVITCVCDSGLEEGI